VSADRGPTLEVGAAETRIPVKGVRKVTAETMVRSAFTAPHATMWATLDVTATIELLELLKGDREWK
jgi:pyruvate dehydrogenase E2 component (dihydrolipoamide acetyltransferase)